MAEYTAQIDRSAYAAEPLAYGADVACGFDVDPLWTTRAPNDPLLLSDYATRRLITDRGTLVDDRDWGKSVYRYLNRALTDRERQSAAGELRQELIQDDRLRDVTVVFVPVGNAWGVSIRLWPKDPETAAPELTLALDGSGQVYEVLSRG